MNPKAKAFSDILDRVDLSSNSSRRWDPAYRFISRALGLSEEDIYFAYVNKAGNAQVRIAQQMPVTRMVRLAIAVCGADDHESVSYHRQARLAFGGRSSLEAVVYLWRFAKRSEPSIWQPRMILFRTGVRCNIPVSDLWPHVSISKVDPLVKGNNAVIGRSGSKPSKVATTASALSKQLDNVKLSSTSNSKWEQVSSVARDLLGLREDELYVAYLNSASNAQVRIAKQMPMNAPVRVALGICGSSDWHSTSYASQAEKALAGRPTLEVVVYFWRDAGKSSGWEPRFAFCREGSKQAAVLRDLWPTIRIFFVQG